MEAAASLLNGERAVVVMFLSRIVMYAESSVLYESLALVLLAVCALVVETRAEAPGRISSLKTRPGASCGVMLGAVTLPAVLVSKMIQQSRGYLLGEIELEELEYLKLQYWATAACCFCVLLFVAFVSKVSSASKNSLMQNCWDVKFCIICVASFTALCSLSLITTHGWGLLATLKLFYVFCHGFAAVKVIQHIIHTFFSCASIGEALLVTSGLIHYFGDMIACTVTEICRRLVSSGLVSAQFGINRSEISTIIQGTLFGLLLFPFLFKFLVRIWGHFSSSFNLDSRKYEIGRALVFYVFLSFIVIGIIPMWMQFVQEFSRHPILWIVGFVFSEPYKRLSLCIHWVGLIGVAVLRFYSISKHSKVERILLRKYYHLLAVCMFVPALIYQPMFLDLAFGAALAVFLVLEIIRIWRIWPLGQLVHKFMTAFTDHRDSDILIVSHFSLLLGCALPIWMSSQYNDRPLALFAGILILGIGDTMASMVGHKYGVLRWSKTGKKTIEGTAAGITSMLAASLSLLPLLASTGYLVTESWFPLVFAVTVSGLLEAYTAQLDNAFIPLVFYSLLCL
uniref:dolichol kinase n=1 Tax=Kalanchoe fedtschenkoi TaxID=63787 RepID=A0A7N0TLC8_KALFE